MDPDGFALFVRRAVNDVHTWGGGKVQVGEELKMSAPLDGSSPGCFEAVAAGVAAALDERDRIGADVLIGVNAAGLADEAFWQRLAAALSAELVCRLDYLELDILPDVFQPIPLHQIADATAYLLATARHRAHSGGFPFELPLHITETGWPTGTGRDEARQAQILDIVANAAFNAQCNITAYELFGLRDVVTSDQWQTGWGVLRDDNTRKPAFEMMREIFARYLCT